MFGSTDNYNLSGNCKCDIREPGVLDSQFLASVLTCLGTIEEHQQQEELDMDISYSRFNESPVIISADEDLEDAEPISLKKQLVFELGLSLADTDGDGLTLEENLDLVLREAGIDPSTVRLAN